MIKTPVYYRSDSENMYDRKGCFLAHISKLDVATEMQKRINMHDELVAMLKDIALVDGGSICIRSKIAKARELLEKCK
jgi:hypothetical protein